LGNVIGMSEHLPRKSQYALAGELALRLENAGEEPYASEESRYVVLENGETVEFGRPRKGHRMFPDKTLLKNQRLAEGFAAFADTTDISDCVFWSICTPTTKTGIDELEEDYESFNKLINCVFTDLRENCDFELFAFGTHIEFDKSTNMFDVHGHFVGRIPVEHREAARRKITQAFSRTHTPDQPIRSPRAVVYYLARTFSLQKMLGWPVPALVAVWKLGKRRFHFCRAAGDFQKYRKKQSDSNKPALRRRRNVGTSDNSVCDRTGGDQPLTTRLWRVGGERIRGTLYETRSRTAGPLPVQPPAPPLHNCSSGPAAYPSASCTTTQTGLPASAGGPGVTPPAVNPATISNSTNSIRASRLNGFVRRAAQNVANFIKRLIGKIRRNE
jgi:hypothetical protein